jgi:hypothetical protein
MYRTEVRPLQGLHAPAWRRRHSASVRMRQMSRSFRGNYLRFYAEPRSNLSGLRKVFVKKRAPSLDNCRLNLLHDAGLGQRPTSRIFGR